MIKLGVIGFPLKHTLSPVMHNAALKEMALEGIYLPYEILPEKLEDAAKGFVALGFSGYNVTIPYKVNIMQYLDEVTPVAQKVGAVNTVIIDKNSRTTGDNTDVYGFVSTFSEEDKDFLKAKNAVILGAGGASRAVGVGLIQLGLSSIELYDVSIDSAESTRDVLIKASTTTKIMAKSIDQVALKNVDLVVNANPVGMYPKIDRAAINLDLLDDLNKNAIIFDLIYRPDKTLLLQTANQKGHKVYNGTEMLVQQGAKALNSWTNKNVPDNIMRDNLINSLNND